MTCPGDEGSPPLEYGLLCSTTPLRDSLWLGPCSVHEGGVVCRPQGQPFRAGLGEESTAHTAMLNPPLHRAKPSNSPRRTGGSARGGAVRNLPPHQAHRCHWEGLLELRERWVSFCRAGIAIWKDLQDSPWFPSKEC